jgi:hypothetical protein
MKTVPWRSSHPGVRTCRQTSRAVRRAVVIAISGVTLLAGAPIASAGQPYLDQWGIALIGSHREDHHNVYHYRAECRDAGMRCPRFLGDVSPDLAGECLIFDLDKRVDGVWTDVAGWNDTRCRTMVSGEDPDYPHSKRLVRYRYGDLESALGNYRVKWFYPAGQSHMPVDSSWIYFRVVL